MERQLLAQFYRWLWDLSCPRIKRVQISDRWIVLTFLWAVLCDRPISWACQGENWPTGFLLTGPPSASTMSRRLKSSSVQRLLALVGASLNPPAPPGSEHWIDGKPLPVGPATQDPDAKVGRGAGMLAKGYKLHALCSCGGSVEAWRVEPLNVAEPKVAMTFLPMVQGPGYLVGDHLFDWRVLYHEAGARGVQLVVTPEKNGTPVPGRRRQDPHRVIGLVLAHSPKGKGLLHRRFGIDRIFGRMGNEAGGLSPLPNWVRRLPRVRNWVAGKLIWFAFRRQFKTHALRRR